MESKSSPITSLSPEFSNENVNPNLSLIHQSGVSAGLKLGHQQGGILSTPHLADIDDAADSHTNPSYLHLEMQHNAEIQAAKIELGLNLNAAKREKLIQRQMRRKLENLAQENSILAQKLQENEEIMAKQALFIEENKDLAENLINTTELLENARENAEKLETQLKLANNKALAAENELKRVQNARNNELEALNRHAEALKSQLSTVTQRNFTETQQLAALTKENQQLREQNSAKTAEIAEKSTKINESQLELAQNQRDFASSKQEIDNLRAKMTQLMHVQSDLEHLKGKISVNETENQQNTVEKVEILRENAVFQAKLAQTSEELSQNAAKIMKLSSELSELQQKYSEERRKVDDLLEKQRTNKSLVEFNALGADLATTKAELRESLAQTAQNNAANSSLMAQITQLQAELGQNLAKIALLQQEITQFQRKVNDLQANETELQRERAGWQQERTKFAQNCLELQREVHKLARNREKLLHSLLYQQQIVAEQRIFYGWQAKALKNRGKIGGNTRKLAEIGVNTELSGEKLVEGQKIHHLLLEILRKLEISAPEAQFSQEISPELGPDQLQPLIQLNPANQLEFSLRKVLNLGHNSTILGEIRAQRAARSKISPHKHYHRFHGILQRIKPHSSGHHQHDDGAEISGGGEVRIHVNRNPHCHHTAQNSTKMNNTSNNNSADNNASSQLGSESVESHQ